MKTEKQSNITFATFDEIETGEVFAYDDEIYMAIDEVYISIDKDYYNAIHLESADFVYIPHDAHVTPLPDAKLVY